MAAIRSLFLHAGTTHACSCPPIVELVFALQKEALLLTRNVTAEDARIIVPMKRGLSRLARRAERFLRCFPTPTTEISFVAGTFPLPRRCGCTPYGSWAGRPKRR